MADLSILAGATSQSINVDLYILATGAPQTGLVFNSSALTANYSFTGTNATSVSITLATLAAVNSAYSSGGFKEIDATGMPGIYRLDLPNAALAAAKGRELIVTLTGFSGMATRHIKIELTAVDNQSTAFGLVLAKTTNITGFNDIAASAVVSSGAITTSGGAVSTVTTVTNQLTAAQVATGIWQDTTAGDFTVASSIGKSLYTSGVVPGGSGGILISGTNSGTTTFGALTSTGSFTISDGLLISRSTSNASAITATGNGSGSGIVATSGSGLAADAVQFNSAATAGNGLVLLGKTTGAGLKSTGGTTGNGFNLIAGSTSGDGFVITTTNGNAANWTANGASKVGFMLNGGTGAGHAINLVAGGTSGVGLNAAGHGTGAGILATGGATGPGMNIIGGATSGDAVDLSATVGTATVPADLRTTLGTTSAGAAGYVGIDWSAINAPTSTQGLTGTTISSAQTIASVTTVTNLTNAPTNGDFTAAMKTSLNAATPVATLSTAYDFAKGTVAMTESYSTIHAAPTPAQILFEMRGILAENNVTATTVTTKKIDGTTTAETFTINSATAPTTITRAT